jgi:hypothetical protein
MNLQEHAAAIQAAIDAAAKDEWYVRTDEIDEGIYLSAGEYRWMEGTQGREVADLDLPEDTWV